MIHFDMQVLTYYICAKEAMRNLLLSNNFIFMHLNELKIYLCIISSSLQLI